MENHFTNILSLDKYLTALENKSKIVSVWEQGSYIEGIADNFSDRDIIVLWENGKPNFHDRVAAAEGNKLCIYEIKDVDLTQSGYDMIQSGLFRFNIIHTPIERQMEWFKSIQKPSIPSDIEAILMAIDAFKGSHVFFQRLNTVKHLSSLITLSSKKRDAIIRHFKKKAEVDLYILKKSACRVDLIQFLKYLEKTLRFMQILYCLKHKHRVVSSKFFEQRFAQCEKTQFVELVHTISNKLNMNDIYCFTEVVAASLGIKARETYKA